MYRNIGRVATATVLATALVVTGAPAASATGGGGDRKLLREGVDDLIEFDFTGIQALTRDGRRTAAARAGVADIETNEPVPANGYFRMASNTKTFIAVILLQLVGEGRLGLDDTVERWLPGVVTGNGNDGSAITVRQLLQHQSGVPEYDKAVPMYNSTEGFLAHRFDHWEPEELVALAMKQPPTSPPGAEWSYSNTNYLLAGMIISRVTGARWDAELDRRILRPAGMTQTFYPGDDPDLPEPHAQAYDMVGDDGTMMNTTRWNTTSADATAGLVTTPSDLARFWQALRSGRLLRPAQFAEMHRTVPTGGGNAYGLGVFFHPSPCGGYWGHDGAGLGWYTWDGVSPDGRRAVVISFSSLPRDLENAGVAAQRTQQLIVDALC